MGEQTFFETTRILTDFFVVDKSWNLTRSPKDKIIFIKNGIQNVQSVLRSDKSLILKKVFEVKMSLIANVLPATCYWIGELVSLPVTVPS